MFHKRTQPKIPIETHYVGIGDDSMDHNTDDELINLYIQNKKFRKQTLSPEARAQGEKAHQEIESRLNKMLLGIQDRESKFLQTNKQHLHPDFKYLDNLSYTLVLKNGMLLPKERPKLSKKNPTAEERRQVEMSQRRYDERGKILELMKDERGYFKYKQMVPESKVPKIKMRKAASNSQMTV